LDLLWRLRKFCKFCVTGATETSNGELNITRVDAGSITAVVMLKLKWQRAGNGCDWCRSERLRLLEEKLQNALLQIDDLTRKNKALEEQLRLAAGGTEVGRRDTMPGDRKVGECLVLGDLIIHNVGSECLNRKVECFPGIRMEQLNEVIEKKDLGNPETVIIHVGTNNLRRTGHIDYVTGDVYDLVNTAKSKFSTSIVVLSGVLQGRDMSWQHTGAISSRYEWVARMLGVTFVDPKSWVNNWDSGRDGLHINQSGARHIGQLYSRVCGISSGRQKMRSE